MKTSPPGQYNIPEQLYTRHNLAAHTSVIIYTKGPPTT